MEELFEFLRALRKHNNREWFKEHKAQYDALHKWFVGIVEQLIGKIAAFDTEISGLEAGSCVYRIYRDIRFSPDKTRYKTHFGAYMTGFGGRTSPYGGYYLHLEPDGPFISGGVWCPTPAMLKKLRHDIYDNIDEFAAILEDKKFKKVFGELEGDVLKRMPDGFPKDCPYEEILKHKSFVVSSTKSEPFFSQADWLEKVVEDFRMLYPFNKFLNYTIGAFFGKG